MLKNFFCIYFETVLCGEFYSTTHELFKEEGIHHYFTNDSTQKVSPTERAILTIKTKVIVTFFEFKGILIHKICFVTLVVPNNAA